MARPRRGEGALKRWLLLAGQLGLTVLVTWLIVDRVGLGLDELGDVDASLWIPGPVLFSLATALLLAAYLMSASLWGRIVVDLGGPRLPAREAVRIFMIANLGRYLPGKLWQIAGLAALAKTRGVPAATAAGAAVLGQGVALVAATAVGLGALLGGPEAYRPWGMVGAAVVGVLAGLLAVPRVSAGLVRAWFRLARSEPPSELPGAHTIRWLGLYALNWMLYAASFWVLVESLGFGEGSSPLPVASAFAAAYVVGYAMIFAPAGLGPREGFLIVFLTPHLGAAPSGVVAIVARVWTTLVEVVPAAAFWIAHVVRRARGDGTTEAA
ncbi:MAG: hypothetical protein AB7T31_14945 [Gemmatimonadales bacterium]